MKMGWTVRRLSAVQKSRVSFIWLTETVFFPSHNRHLSGFRLSFRKPSGGSGHFVSCLVQQLEALAPTRRVHTAAYPQQ
jgi:hypothetical protein